MLTCPMCKKKSQGLEKQCLNCRTDLSLLVDYVEHLREGLQRADALTRQGQLGEAVWAYLQVLEIDPDNSTARKQVGMVSTAVRQFDEESYRKWRKLMHRQGRLRRWMSNVEGSSDGSWVGALLWGLVVFVALLLGYFLGLARSEQGPPPEEPPPAEARA